MRTGIYGGTFNPIHKGHLHLIQAFAHRLKLDRVLLIPTAQPPHKPNIDLAAGVHRLAMCALGAKTLALPIEVSTIELDRGEKSYTADTLVQLHKLYPSDDLFLLMGEDMFLTVAQWYAPPIIFANATLAAAPRSIDGVQRLEKHGKALQKIYPNLLFTIVDIQFMDISSTAVRQGARGFVPETVQAYIDTHGLYRREL